MNNQRRLCGIGSIMTAVGLLMFHGAALAEQASVSFVTPLWNDQVQAWFEEEAIPQFESRHPGVTVDVSYAVWGQLHAQIIAAAVSGVGPDVYVTIGEGGAKVDGENGLALALDEYVADWDALNDFIPASVETQTFNGRLYAIPNTLNLRTYTANRQFFQQAGLDPEAPLGDWSAFLGTVRRLNDLLAPQEQSGFRANLNLYFEQVMNEAQAPWLGDDDLLHMDTPEARRAIDHLIALWNAGGAETRMFVVPQRGSANDLRRGTAALAWIDIQQASNVARTIGADDIYQPDPVQDTAVMPATGLAITTSSENPDAAWDWIAFLSEPDNLNAFNAHLGRIPPRLSTLRVGAVGDDPLLQRAAQLAARFGQPVGLSNRYGTIANIRNQVERRLYAMLTGDVSPAQAMSDIELFWSARVDAQ